MKIKKSKKGFAIAFNWIFVVIVGAIILIFFVRFAFQHKATSEQLTTRQIVTTIDDSLNAFSNSLKSNKDISFGLTTEIRFGCEDISSLDYSKKSNKIIFSPKILKGKKIQAWTQLWEFPFAVDNFFYLANEKTRFYLIYDSTSFNFVKNLKIPERFSVLKTSSLNLNNVKRETSTLENVNFIFFTNPKNIDEIFEKIPQANIIEINQDKNKITFYPNKEKLFYLGEEMMYGAIFSPSHESYKCLLEKSLTKLSMMSDLYSEKAYLLFLKNKNPSCQYMQLKNILKAFSNSAEKETLYEYAEKINQQNKNLNENDCPTIF